MKLETLKSIVALVAGFTLLYLGYRFFYYSIAYLAAEPPRVTAGLMAGLAGFTFTAASVTLLRDWIILEKLAKTTREEGGKHKQ